MKMTASKFVIYLTGCYLAYSLATAQNAGVRSDGKLVSLSESLRNRGIDLSPPSLIAALHNVDPEIRSLAALKLAEDQQAQAATLIADALALEKNAKSRIAMSEALWTLNDPRGLAALQGMCTDRSLQIDAVIEAVQHLNILGESSVGCAGPVFEYLDSHPGTASRRRVLPALICMYKWVTPAQAGRIAQELQSMLSDPEPYLRMAASDAVAQANVRSAADALRAEISKEENPEVRSHLQSNLDMLEKNK